jgi:hypothetical protein
MIGFDILAFKTIFHRRRASQPMPAKQQAANILSTQSTRIRGDYPLLPVPSGSTTMECYALPSTRLSAERVRCLATCLP